MNRLGHTLSGVAAGVWSLPVGCPVHHASDHHMRDWPQTWRFDGRFTERLCPHGIGHPDPDDTRAAARTHGCDGCCTKPARLPEGGSRYER